MDNNNINNEKEKGETKVSPSNIHNIYSYIKIDLKTLDIIIFILLASLVIALIIGLNNRGFIIEFDSQGGTNIPFQKHMYGENIDYQIPTREGYQFNGWALDRDCSNMWNDEYEITASMKLYACWIK